MTASTEPSASSAGLLAFRPASSRTAGPFQCSAKLGSSWMLPRSFTGGSRSRQQGRMSPLPVMAAMYQAKKHPPFSCLNEAAMGYPFCAGVPRHREKRLAPGMVRVPPPQAHRQRSCPGFGQVVFEEEAPEAREGRNPVVVGQKDLTACRHRGGQLDRIRSLGPRDRPALGDGAEDVPVRSMRRSPSLLVRRVILLDEGRIREPERDHQHLEQRQARSHRLELARVDRLEQRIDQGR